jgi:hypothetical protein
MFLKLTIAIFLLLATPKFVTLCQQDSFIKQFLHVGNDRDSDDIDYGIACCNSLLATFFNLYCNNLRKIKFT